MQTRKKRYLDCAYYQHIRNCRGPWHINTSHPADQCSAGLKHSLPTYSHWMETILTAFSTCPRCVLNASFVFLECAGCFYALPVWNVKLTVNKIMHTQNIDQTSFDSFINCLCKQQNFFFFTRTFFVK
jgi:hypothetical protein